MAVLVQGAQAVSEAASRRAEANAALHLATSQSDPLRREAHGEPNGVNPADSPGGSSVSRDSAAQAAWDVFRQAQEVKRKQEHPDSARNTQDGTVEPANVPGGLLLLPLLTEVSLFCSSPGNWFEVASYFESFCVSCDPF